MPVGMAKRGRAGSLHDEQSRWRERRVLDGSARATKSMARAQGGYVGGARQGEEAVELTTWRGDGKVKKGGRRGSVHHWWGLRGGQRRPCMAPAASREEEGVEAVRNRMEINLRWRSPEGGGRQCSSGKIR
jgi:hypothetical protein